MINYEIIPYGPVPQSEREGVVWGEHRSLGSHEHGWGSIPPLTLPKTALKPAKMQASKAKSATGK